MSNWQFTDGARVIGDGFAAAGYGIILAGPTMTNSQSIWTSVSPTGKRGAGDPLSPESFLLCIEERSTGGTGGGQTPPGSVVFVDVGVCGVGRPTSETLGVGHFFMVQRGSSDRAIAYYLIQHAIPQTTQICCRYQTNNTNTRVRVSLAYLYHGFLSGPYLNVHVTIGADGTTTSGTLVDPGAIANNKGAWAQLGAALFRDIRVMTVALMTYNHFSPAPLARMRLDIGVGPNSGAVTPIVEDLFFSGSAVGDTQVMPPNIGPLHVHVPNGSQLWARLQSESNTMPQRQMAVVLYCQG